MPPPEYRQYCRVPDRSGQRQAPIQLASHYANSRGRGVRSSGLLSKDSEADSRKGTGFARRSLEVAGDDPSVLVNAAVALAYFGEDIGAMMGLADRALALNLCFSTEAGPHPQTPQDIELSRRFASGVGSRSAPIGTPPIGNFLHSLSIG